MLTLILIIQREKEGLASVKGHGLHHEAKCGPLLVNQRFDVGGFVLG